MLRQSLKISFCQLRYFSQRAAKAQENARRQWESVIGLEVHAQISSKAKLFSAAGTEFSAPINNQVSFMDAALPGTLPVLNQRCVEAAVMTALALNCHVNMVSKFDRKHYFYADLPAGYQITQQRMPIATKGHLSFTTENARDRQEYISHRVGITQVQLEQDSGKSLHDSDSKVSLIDLNRAGVGLMEIVTEPDFRSADEAAAFIRELQLILVTLGTCDGKMSEGSLRVDASVSMRRPNAPLGIRAEVKNINSVRFVAKAIEYEIERQIKILEGGGEVINETRSFDFESGTTIAMRDKEKVHDYRFHPEPNLPPLVLYSDKTLPKTVKGGVVNVDEVRRGMPPLPETTRERLGEDYNISRPQTLTLVNDPPLMKFFEKVVALQKNKTPKQAYNLILNEVLTLLNLHDLDIETSPISNATVAEILEMVENNEIPKNISKKVLEEVFKRSLSPREVVKVNDWGQITDLDVITQICDRVIQQNPDTVAAYLNGKSKVFQRLMGQVLKESRGRSDPKKTSEILNRKLEELKKCL